MSAAEMVAGACEGTVLDTASLRPSTANGKACRPALTSLVFSAEDDRAKSTSATLLSPYRRLLPAPDPFGRSMVVPCGKVSCPPPPAWKEAMRKPASPSLKPGKPSKPSAT